QHRAAGDRRAAQGTGAGRRRAPWRHRSPARERRRQDADEARAGARETRSGGPRTVMPALVLDASSALRIVLDPAREVETLNKLKHAEAVYAPALFVAETANALWKYVNGGHVALDNAKRLHVDATTLVDRFVADSELFPEAL